MSCTQPEEPNRLVVLGAAGTGNLMAECTTRTSVHRFLGFLDDDPEKQRSGWSGKPVLGPLSSWKKLPGDVRFLCSLYGPKRTRRLAAVVASLGIPQSRWMTVCDPFAFVSTSAHLGRGVFVGPGCVVEPGARIADMTVLLGNVYVAHDTLVGEYVCCANSVSIAGGVSIGDYTYIGANASIREYTKIGSASIVGMGSVVLHDVLDGHTVVGNPAHGMGDRG